LGVDDIVLKEMRREIIKKMEAVRNDRSLTDREKYDLIVSLASKFGKACLEELAAKKESPCDRGLVI
jgi:hypothetical protein